MTKITHTHKITQDCVIIRTKGPLLSNIYDKSFCNWKIRLKGKWEDQKYIWMLLHLRTSYIFFNNDRINLSDILACNLIFRIISVMSFDTSGLWQGMHTRELNWNWYIVQTLLTIEMFQKTFLGITELSQGYFCSIQSKQ